MTVGTMSDPRPQHAPPHQGPVRAAAPAPAHAVAPVVAPVVAPASPPLAAAAPVTHAAPAVAPLTAPRRVRATAPAVGFPLEALLHPAAGPSSILDVDPRLLVVRRSAPTPAPPARRSLAAPVDERRERRSLVRRRILTAVGGATAVAFSVMSVGLALA